MIFYDFDEENKFRRRNKIYNYNFNRNKNNNDYILEAFKELLGKMGNRSQMSDIGDEREIVEEEFKEYREDEDIELYRITTYFIFLERYIRIFSEKNI